MAKHGAPDWYNVQPLSLVYHAQDMGELAVRLGSPYILDRRGKVVYLTSFEGGLEDWTRVTTGLDSDVYPVITPTNSPPMALDLHTMTGVGSLAGVFRRVPYVSLSKYGLAFVWSPPDNDYIYEMQINHYWSGNYDHYALRYTAATHMLSINTDTGYVNILDVGALIGGAGTWYFIKLVVDLENHNYERILFQSTETSVKTSDPERTTTSQSDHVYFYAYIENVDAFVKDSLLDNAVITAEED